MGPRKIGDITRFFHRTVATYDYDALGRRIEKVGSKTNAKSRRLGITFHSTIPRGEYVKVLPMTDG